MPMGEEENFRFCTCLGGCSYEEYALCMRCQESLRLGSRHAPKIPAGDNPSMLRSEVPRVHGAGQHLAIFDWVAKIMQ